MKIGLMAIECILKFSSQRDEKKTEDKITPTQVWPQASEKVPPKGEREETNHNNNGILS